MSILVKIGIIIAIVSAYLLAKNIDNASGKTIKLYLAAIILGIILFIVGLSSKENYTNITNITNTITEYYSKINQRRKC